jgi:hypothetical protein
VYLSSKGNIMHRRDNKPRCAYFLYKSYCLVNFTSGEQSILLPARIQDHVSPFLEATESTLNSIVTG